MFSIAGIPDRPPEPLKLCRLPTGDLWLEWRAGEDRPEDWPVVKYVVEATDERTAGDWTEIGSVDRDPLSDAPNKFRVGPQFQNGTYAFRVLADNQAALSPPLESDWATPDKFGMCCTILC